MIDRSAILVNRSTKPVRIEGHTDNVGTRAYNQTLSEGRARVAAQALIAKGVAANRITTKGMAFDKPAASNDAAEGRARNRRTEITLLGEKIETLMGPSH
ncbi:Photosystem I chlorophyll a apoprotein A2 [compost metagenome]